MFCLCLFCQFFQIFYTDNHVTCVTKTLLYLPSQLCLFYILFLGGADFISKDSQIFLKSGQRGHPFFVPDLRGKTLHLSSLTLMLAVGFL